MKGKREGRQKKEGEKGSRKRGRSYLLRRGLDRERAGWKGVGRSICLGGEGRYWEWEGLVS